MDLSVLGWVTGSAIITLFAATAVFSIWYTIRGPAPSDSDDSGEQNIIPGSTLNKNKR
jgi:hypothetical protein